MMLKIALALVLALLGFPAWALSPSYSGAGGGEGAGHFNSSTVAGAGAAFNVSAGELIRVPIFVEIGTTGTAPAIIAVTNDVTPLAWRRRASIAGTVGENSGGGGVTVCTGNFELWEAYSPSAITATHVSVRVSAASDSTAWYVNRYANTWGAARPSDGNTSLPVAISNNAGAGAAPTATIPSTSQADDLIVGYTAYCGSELANSGAAGYTINNSFEDGGGNYNQQGAISKSVSAPQSSLPVTFGGGISAPAGFFMIADALTNDAPPPKSQATSAAVATDIIVTGGGGSAPAAAVAAGFTTLAFVSDFTQPFYATPSNWLDCAGAGSPQWFRGWFLVEDGAPCGNITQATDPLISTPALDLYWNRASWSASPITNRTIIETCDSTACNTGTFFNFAYVEIVARQDVLYGTQTTDLWSPAKNGMTLEFDGIEWFLNSVDSDACSHNNASGIVSCVWIGTNPPNGPVDFTQYHTYGWRVTSDGSTGSYFCVYIDNALEGCTTYAATGPQIAATGDGFPWVVQMQNGMLCRGGYGSEPCDSVNIHTYVKSVKVWACSGWNTGSKCFSSSPNP